MAKTKSRQYLIITLMTISIFVVPLLSQSFAIESLNDADLEDITAQEGVSIILDNIKVTYPGGTISIGGEDGLGIPEAPNGAWFVFEFDRVVQLDVEKGAFDIDAFTTNTSMTLGQNYTLPAGKTAALITFGEAFFHINNTEALFTLKFGNNPQGIDGDGVTEFADTVCSFALNGSTMTFKSDDAKMYIFSH